MMKLDGVPVKTRLPVAAWALTLLSSLIATGGTGHVYQASMTQLLTSSSCSGGGSLRTLVHKGAMQWITQRC